MPQHGVFTLDEILNLGRVEVVIDGFGYRGEGWTRLQDGWLSVRGALPGERVVVDVEPRAGRSRRIWGKLHAVVEASPRRNDPACPQFPGCTGCQLRHLSVVDELEFKTDAIAECLEKYAELPRAQQPKVETVAVKGAVRSDAFRVRSRLTIAHDGGRWQVGLYSDDGVQTMTSCPALTDSARRGVARFEEALAQCSPAAAAGLHHARIAAPVHGHGYVELEVDEDVGLEPLLAALDERLPPQFGLAVIDAAKRRRHVRGPDRIRLPMADLRLEVGYDDWFHATLGPAEVMYDAVRRWLAVRPGERIIDAGCGVGTIGLLCAAAGAEVVGFDVNPASVETAELNAIANGLELEFVCGGWEKVFRELALQRREFDTAVINPMRDPLGHRPLAYLRRLGVEQVLYLGPSVVPAAKDIGVLRGLGYEVAQLAAVNLHPATYHVMLAALLRRG